MENELPTLIIILLSLSSGILGSFATTWIYIYRENRLFKVETLKKLTANRHNTKTGEFQEALNEIYVVYNNCPEVKEALSALSDAASNPNISNEESLLALITAMCNEVNIDFEDSDRELFLTTFDVG